MPGLGVLTDAGRSVVAINDVVIVRGGPWQITVAIEIDGVLYARVSGDGVVVATPLGSSAYTIAAGGPILAPGAHGFVVTPLAPHGGSCPPLVADVVTTAPLRSHRVGSERRSELGRFDDDASEG